MSVNRTDFDTDDDREHFDPAFEESFQEEPDTDDTSFPEGFDTTAAGATADGETSGISITAADIFSLNTDKTLRGLQTYQDDTKDSDFVYAAEAGADMMQREWSGKIQYYTGSGVMVGAITGGLYGSYEAVRQTKGQGWRLIANKVANFGGGRASRVANAMGCLAIMYSSLGYFSTFIRDDAVHNDQYNSVAAAAATGLLYKSTCKKVAALPTSLTIPPGFLQTALRSGVPKLKYAAMTTVVFSTINYADILARQGAVKSYKTRNAPAMM
jgi:hypothetical protein